MKEGLKIEEIKSKILGKRYELSFSFISKKEIKKLNKTYRNKNEPTDILSFPLDKKNGEILICKEIAKNKSAKFLDPITGSSITFANYLVFLVIHGMLHLKKYHHGNKMEKLENLYFKKFV